MFLVTTPIGNLSDITLRALEILKKVDYILCEDTRHSRHLLDHYGIVKPLKSYHKFNEKARLPSILTDLKEGKEIALITDAGTPGISDPGFLIVKECRREGLPLFHLPGPCALIAALVSSGFEMTRFQFVGFLPKTSGRLEKMIDELLLYSGTSIAYESPRRLEKVLKVFEKKAPERELCLASELTKKFEKIWVGTAKALLEKLSRFPLKGEVVLLLKPLHV